MSDMTDVLPAVQALASGVDVPVDDASRIGPGFAGFAVMFALAVATVLLMRSMVGHLRKVRYGPDPAAQGPDAGATATPHTRSRPEGEAVDGVHHDDGGTDGGGDGGGGGD